MFQGRHLYLDIYRYQWTALQSTSDIHWDSLVQVHTDRQRDRQTDRETDRQTERQTDRQRDRQRQRQTVRQTDR